MAPTRFDPTAYMCCPNIVFFTMKYAKAYMIMTIIKITGNPNILSWPKKRQPSGYPETTCAFVNTYAKLLAIIAVLSVTINEGIFPLVAAMPLNSPKPNPTPSAVIIDTMKPYEDTSPAETPERAIIPPTEISISPEIRASVTPAPKTNATAFCLNKFNKLVNDKKFRIVTDINKNSNANTKKICM
ncbi:hypothetical protein ES703_94885 [subsurface metagenome]